MTKKPFGYSLLIDLYNCTPGLTDDLEFTYRFLEELVHKLGMTQLSLPTVYHAPTEYFCYEGGYSRKEKYPDKSGVSAWQPLIESGIQIHTINDKNFVSIDIYTCGFLDDTVIAHFCKEKYGASRIDSQTITRGIDYAKSDASSGTSSTK